MASGRPSLPALEGRLRTAARRRAKALDEASNQLDAVRKLFPAAREAGMPILRIHELTGVSRTVLHEWERARKLS